MEFLIPFAFIYGKSAAVFTITSMIPFYIAAVIFGLLSLPLRGNARKWMQSPIVAAWELGLKLLKLPHDVLQALGKKAGIGKNNEGH